MGYLKHFLLFLNDIFHSRNLIFELTKNDFKKKYLGSYLGILWAFIQPTITIFIFWFVFEVGFKSKPTENFPFIIWLVSGMIPWFFFSDSLTGATWSIIENSYLVNKVVFRVSILPVIKILSALIIHLFFIGFLFIMLVLYGYSPSVYYFQVIYYLAATIILVLGLSWITSSLVIFLRDVGQAVGVFLQFAFWATPIFWSIKILPAKYQFFIKLNPVYYIIEGYRDTFMYHRWFWEDIGSTGYFWVVTLVIFVGGALIFRKMRPHFADVL